MVGGDSGGGLACGTIVVCYSKGHSVLCVRRDTLICVRWVLGGGSSAATKVPQI